VYQIPRYRKVLAIAFIGLFHLACPLHQNKMRPTGPHVKASLVIYFKQGVTDDQIEKFWHEVLSKPDPQGRGYYHRSGVGEISRIYPALQGHEGISLLFFPDATNDEREEVQRDIRSSPLVYKVLENVIPADVKKID
jgi:hypothetical protein